jgi:hypothetical protein
MSKIFSPWSHDEVDNLNKRQKINNLHPYTCGDCGKDLVAYFSGWRCSDIECKYRQNWAHKQDINGFTLKVSEALSFKGGT